MAAGVIFQLLNFAIAAPISWLRRGIRARSTCGGKAFQPFLPFHFFFLAISLGLIYIYRLYVLKPGGVSTVYSTLLIMLCLLPVLGLIYAFRAFAHERELAQRNAALALRNERLFLQAVKSQVTALDVKDNYTARHSAAVALWATDIAQAMALSKHEQNITHLASLVHDVGKIGVPDEVLNFPGKLERDGLAAGRDPLSERPQDLEDHRPVRRARRGDPLPPREVRRLRLSGGARGGGHPADKPHHLRGRQLLGHGERPSLPQGALQPRWPRASCASTPASSSTRWWWTTSSRCLPSTTAAYQRGELADFDLEFSSDRFLRELPAEPVEEEPGLAVSPRTRS